MSAFYKDTDHTATEDENIRVIHEALKLGVNMLDTSDVYGPYTNEQLVGRAIKGRRAEYCIATKFAFTSGVVDCSPKHVKYASDPGTLLSASKLVAPSRPFAKHSSPSMPMITASHTDRFACN